MERVGCIADERFMASELGLRLFANRVLDGAGYVRYMNGKPCLTS